MNEPALKDKEVIITGGSSVIGRELAHQLADQVAWLIMAAPNVEHLDVVQGECQNREAKPWQSERMSAARRSRRAENNLDKSS